MEELITVWYIKANGTGYYEHNIEHVKEMIDGMDVDSSYGISKRELTKETYDKLPEFMGF